MSARTVTRRTSNTGPAGRRTNNRVPNTSLTPDAAPALEVRRQEWTEALCFDEQHTHNVSLKAITCDRSSLAGKGGSSWSKLWEVRVDIEHQEPAQSVYLAKGRPQYADPSDPAFVTLTVGCPRGEITDGGKRETGKVEPETITIRCQLGHIDALVLALSNALIIGRRDGTFPVARGMKSFSAPSIVTTDLLRQRIGK